MHSWGCTSTSPCLDTSTAVSFSINVFGESLIGTYGGNGKTFGGTSPRSVPREEKITGNFTPAFVPQTRSSTMHRRISLWARPVCSVRCSWSDLPVCRLTKYSTGGWPSTRKGQRGSSTSCLGETILNSFHQSSSLLMLLLLLLLGHEVLRNFQEVSKRWSAFETTVVAVDIQSPA